MDSSSTPCTLCSTLFQTQFPSKIEGQAAKDVVFISGPSYGPAAQGFQKYLEDGQFCPTCREAIVSLHSNMSLIRQLQKEVNVARKVIQDGIHKSCLAWCTRGENPNVSGIGTFFLDQGELGVSEEREENMRLKHEEEISDFTGSGWPAAEEDGPSKLNLENVEEIRPGSLTSTSESSMIAEVLSTSGPEQSQNMPLDVVKAGFVKPVHKSGA